MTTTTPTFQVGDTVRRKASSDAGSTYLVGTFPFEVKSLTGGGVVVDPNRQVHHPSNLELVEARPPESVFDLFRGAQQAGGPAGSVQLSEKLLGQIQEAMSATPLGEQKRDRHIAHIADQDAIIRRRNATIDSYVETIEKQKAQLTEYAVLLEQWESRWNEEVEEAGFIVRDPVLKDSTHTLDKTAYQLGLSSDDAVHALEIGARLFALGLDPSEAGSATMRVLGPESDELDAMLREFHEAFDVERNIYFDCYDIDPDLIKRQHFLQEEVNELLEAILKGDRVAAADALGDIIYIAAGTADLAGIPIMKVLRAIHAANLDKLGSDGKPVPHATIPGKIGKPEGWTGPEADIEKILNGGAS